jgi:hypothetical protein
MEITDLDDALRPQLGLGSGDIAQLYGLEGRSNGSSSAIAPLPGYNFSAAVMCQGW